MTPREQHPLLFLDIDGTLLPFGGNTQQGPPAAMANAHMERLDSRLGIRLAALPCDLVWATTWEDEANIEIAPRLGLPPLPVVHWPEPSAEHEHENRWFGLHWKTRALVEWADGRSFIWVDDEITDADRDWVPAHYRARALLHQVTPSRGLTDEDFTVLDAWLRAS